MRSQNEFSYGGDATVKRPELNKEYQTKTGITLSIIEKA
jgi:sarcosine oxidase subunit delta